MIEKLVGGDRHHSPHATCRICTLCQVERWDFVLFAIGELDCVLGRRESEVVLLEALLTEMLGLWANAIRVAATMVDTDCESNCMTLAANPS